MNRLHTGDTYGKIATRFGISKAVACIYFHQILRRFNMIYRKVISLPTIEECENIREKLVQRGDDFPCVSFIMDCTHTRAMINDGWHSTA